MYRRTRYSVLFVCLSLIACTAQSTNGQGNTMTEEQSNKQKAQIIQWQKATIKHMKFEGGFFGIVTDKGEKLLPMNLSKEYHQVGAQVKIQGQLITDMATIQQWGTPFKITKIELIKAGKPLVDSTNLLY